MKAKEVLERLIIIYDEAINLIKEDPEGNGYEICELMSLVHGICFAAMRRLKLHVYDSRIIKEGHLLRGREFSVHWCATPGSYKTKEENIEALERRVLIMQALLSTGGEMLEEEVPTCNNI